ncbi:MAG: GDSL-type esterase/lipase family protein [Acidobacteriota bacterium]|nr:GDSL-type esterase/lipase family protein [Acidobacteriota bacterium]
MRQPWVWVACCCAVLTACGGSTPTGPSTSPTLSRTRFLAFGDSMTSGEVTNPVGGVGGTSSHHPMVLVPAASYPSRLLSLLQERYVLQAASLSVINAGKSLETAQEGAVRFPGVFAESRAEAVLLMEGVNGLDIAGPDFSTDFIRSMVHVAKAGGARVFVASTLPTITGRPRSKLPAELVVYNTRLQQMALAEQAVYVDLYNTLLPEANTVIGADGLHPTEAGYKRMADVFFAAIQANLEVK